MRFNKFSNEIKSDILATMTAEELCTTVAPISREWRQYAYTPSLWTDVKLDAKIQSKYQMTQILNRCYRLLELTICHAKDLSWIKNCPINIFVRSLDLVQCNISSHIASYLTTIYPHVEIFVDISSNYANDVLAKQIIKWNYIKVIHLESQIGDSNRCLDLISNNCKNLCILLTPKFRYINDKSFINLTTQLGPHLLELVIGGLNNLSCNAYRSLSQCCCLRDLAIFDAEQFNDIDYYNLRELPSLVSVRIRGNEQMFTSRDLFTKNIVLPLKQLTVRNCTRLNYTNLNILIKSCGPNLEMVWSHPTNDLTVADCYKLALENGFTTTSEFKEDDGRIILVILER